MTDLRVAHDKHIAENRVQRAAVFSGGADSAFGDDDVDDVRALVAMLVQADRFGTSIAQALRTHADTSRTKRRQRAEERAGKIGVKLVFPHVFCLFPAFMVVTAGPGVIQLIRFFESNQ